MQQAHDIHSPILQRLIQDWDARRGGASEPNWRDFDILDLKYAVGSLSIVDIHRNPLRFFYRLHGTNIAHWQGYDFTGKFLDEVPDKKSIFFITQHFQETVEQRTPTITRRFDVPVENRLWNLEALALPMSRTGEAFDMLLTAVAVYNHAEMAALVGQGADASPGSTVFHPLRQSARLKVA